MKFTALLVLLAASLAANAWLVFNNPSASALSSNRSSSLSSNPAHDGASGSSYSENAKSDAIGKGDLAKSAQPLVWQKGRSEAESKDFVARLKAAGFPPKAIRSVLENMMRESLEAERSAEARPYWERARLLSKEERTERAAKRLQQQDLIESIMGEEGKPAALMDAAQKQRLFFGLSDDKINALSKIERDYGELRNSTYREGTSSADEYKAAEEQRALLNKEKLTDLATLLSPSELEAYQLRNSDTSFKVSRFLNDVTVSEAEFKQVYQMQKAFDEANPTLGGSFTGETWAKRQSAQLSYNEQLRATLGEDRFYKYAASADSQYAMLSRNLAQYPSVTPATAYQVYQLQNQLMSDISVRKQRPDLNSYNARLETLIGAEAAAAFKKSGNGRMFALPGSPQPTVIRSGNGG